MSANIVMSKALRRNQISSRAVREQEEEQEADAGDELKDQVRSRFPDEMSTLLTREGMAAPILFLLFILVWYGRTPAVACMSWTVVFITLAGAFEGTEEGPNNLQSQAWSLGQAAGVLLGATSLQRHDYPVLLALTTTLLILIVLAPLTELKLDGLALLSSGFSIGGIFLAGFFAGPEAALSMIAILVPAWICGVLGGVAAGITPLHRFYPVAAALGAFSVLAGCWGASHDPPMDSEY
mmetsp:Transcript_6022/g.13915  ORF Transcript_6022/g.13915 Transcript_6022/m.13915 type:complete len:238 (-) Transcript_6022:73-786(-)